MIQQRIRGSFVTFSTHSYFRTSSVSSRGQKHGHQLWQLPAAEAKCLWTVFSAAGILISLTSVVLPGIKYWIAFEVLGETVSRKVSSRPYCKLLFARGRRASLSFFFFLRWSQMVLTRDDFNAKLRMSMWWEFSNETLTHGRSSHVCSECQSGSKQARVNGRSNHDPLVCGVLCYLSSYSLTLSCRTSTFSIKMYMYMSASLFLLVFIMRRKRSLEHLLSMMSAFRSLWTFHNGFMFFSSRGCFKHLSRLHKKSRVASEVYKSAWIQLREEKTWNHCGRSKASKSRHHGK